ncbi:MAG: heme-binding domain-containing protein [Bacteroidota bacterium]
MSIIRKIIVVLAVVLVVIQFIRPKHNEGDMHGPNEIAASPEVRTILEKSCYDCHSNSTVYPWYTNIQPLGWWISNHVNEGKEEFNFSEFNAYKLKRKLHKMKKLKEEIEENEMPLTSYTLIHTGSKLSEEQKTQLLNWVSETTKIISDTIVH